MTAVLVVGDTKRANAWVEALSQSPAIESVRQVGADPCAIQGEIARSASSRVAIAVGGSLGRQLAGLASRLGAAGVVSAPKGVTLPTGFARAPDFDAVPGVGWLAKHLSAANELHLELQGSADGNSEDLSEVVRLGLCVLARLSLDVRVRDVFLEGDGRARLELESPRLQSVTFSASAGGSLMRIVARGDRTSVEVRVERGQERRTLHARGQSQTRAVALPPTSAFALAPLGEPPDAVTLPTGSERVEARLDELPPPPAAFTFLRRLASRWPDDPGAWETSGTLVEAKAIQKLQDPPGASRLELMAFAAGDKPTVILVLAEAEAQELSDRFTHTHTLPWKDGVLWMAAHSGGDLGKLVAMRGAEDPDEHLRAIGSLLGYPACCVEAFSRQHDRSDDARSRHATALRTPADGPWLWSLNNSGVRVVPFFPCSYICTAAGRAADRVLTLLEEADPAAHANLRERLAADVLFFDEGAFIRVQRIDETQRKVGVPEGAPDWLVDLARVLASPGQLQVRRDTLQIHREGSVIAAAERRLPLGVWMPFGAP